MRKGIVLIIVIIFSSGLSLLATSAVQRKAVTLAQAHANYFSIGAAISPEADLASPEKKKFIAAQYNSVTAENQMKPRFIHPGEQRYNWEPADQIVAFARANKMKVRGHTLVWHQSMPEWMLNDGGKAAVKELLYKRLQQHITTVMQRYQNDVYCWDVVNEAISDKPEETFRAADPLHQIAGADYVAQSFHFARQADAKAQLFYNDYRFSNPVKRKKIYNLLKSLKDKGVPIDGVGLQSHYVLDEITEAYLQETINMFSGLGLKVQITELDVSVFNYRDKNSADANQADAAYTTARQQKQLAMYDMLFKVYRRNKDKITGVTFWGAADARVNFRTKRIGKMDYPFLFDEKLQPKKAFYQVTQTVR